MLLKYVLTSFGRRKVRTILMILSLMVSTGLIVTMSATVETIRRSNIDLIASETGRFDLAVSMKDTSPDPFMPIAAVSRQIYAADPRITAVYPRLELAAEFSAGDRRGEGTIIALDRATDDVGIVDVQEGEYDLGPGEAALLEETAQGLDLYVGDIFEAAYSYPLPREAGKPDAAGSSSRRASRPFTVKAIVREDGVASAGIRTGFIADLGDIQKWLDLPERASVLVATVDPALYETNNAETAALQVREVGQAVYDTLGDEYQYAMAKASALSETAQAFLAIQALINTYGLISLGIVGLLIYTLMLTNVQEQRRDMAILRILGAQRSYLFLLVITEVLVIGLIGVSLGIVLGQIITQFVVVPLIQQQFIEQGITSPLVPQLSLSAILPPAAAAFFVLLAASIKPAREAANTKVVHAINPGVADNIQIEDLAQLRERNPNLRMFLGGLALMLIFALIASFEALESFGGPAIQVTIFLLALALLVLGLGLMFFIATVPMERLVLFFAGIVSPRLTYFASRNVKRGQTRNTLISMLVLFSGVLPSFLATQSALENANFENRLRQSFGAELDIVVSEWGRTEEERISHRLKRSFLSEELGQIPEVEEAAALTYAYETTITDPVGFRRARVDVRGVEGRLEDVLFMDTVEFSAGDASALSELLEDRAAIIVSEGLAAHLAVPLGGTVKVQGEGLDNLKEARIIGIARRIPGIDGITRSRLEAQNRSTVLIAHDGFRELRTVLNMPLPPEDERVFTSVKASLAEDADQEDLARLMSEMFVEDYDLWFRFLENILEQNRRSQATQQIFLLVLTMISFTTAVFGVFAVIYVTVYARRIEIGMMKAMGMKRRHLTWMLVIEAIVMTLGAALAGIAAGAAMGYVTFYGERVLAQEHVVFAVDTTVIPFIVVMVVLASMLGAAFSARRIVSKKAVEILRM
jgi:putative ABC transport system permease protein